MNVEALAYLEQLIIRLLCQIVSCQPHNYQDVEERVQKTFPEQIKGIFVTFKILKKVFAEIWIKSSDNLLHNVFFD